MSNSDKDKNCDDAEAKPDLDMNPTTEFSEEQVQIVKDVVGTALEDNEASEDKSNSGAQLCFKFLLTFFCLRRLP